MGFGGGGNSGGGGIHQRRGEKEERGKREGGGRRGRREIARLIPKLIFFLNKNKNFEGQVTFLTC